jgi:hypothetical protein
MASRLGVRRDYVAVLQTFTHHILDEMYLLKKMELVHAIDPLPSEVIKTIRKVNALRNAFAHSFFPENRKEHRKHKKVLYSGKDIHTHEGLELFLNDWQRNSAVSSASPPKPPSKSSRNAPHPTTPKRP